MENQQKTGLHTGLGIGSLVVGIVALLISFIPCLGQFSIFVAPIGVLLGISGYYIAKKSNQSSGLNLGGIIISLIAFCIAWYQASTINSANNYMSKQLGGKGDNSMDYPYIAFIVIVIAVLVFINYSTRKKNEALIESSETDVNSSTTISSSSTFSPSVTSSFDMQGFIREYLKVIVGVVAAILLGFGVWNFFIKTDPVSDGKKGGTLYCDCRKEDSENRQKTTEKFISEFASYNFKTQQEAKDKYDKIKSDWNKSLDDCFGKAEEKVGKIKLSYLNDASKMGLFEEAFKTINQSCNDAQNDARNSEFYQKADALIAALPLYEPGKGPSVSDLPFTGKKYYSTHPMMSGNGTPQYFVEIREDGDVYFGYDAPHYNGPAEHKSINAGKFQPVIECKNSDYATGRYFSISSKLINIVDETGHIISDKDCCDMMSGSDAPCPCHSSLW